MSLPRCRVLLALAALILLAALSVHAAGRTSTRANGFVVAIDQLKRSFTIQPDGQTRQVVIEWQTKHEFFGGSRTEFFDGENRTGAAILKKGSWVHVRYHEALFTPNRAVLVRVLKPAGSSR